MQCFCIKNVNDIFRGKIFIENLLIKHEEIEKEMELNDFIFKYFNISKYVYLHGNDIFPITPISHSLKVNMKIKVQ